MALWFDLVLIFLLVWLITRTAFVLGFYFPFEVTFIVLFVLGDILILVKLGSTPGKYLFGFNVSTRRGGSLSLGRVLLRECLGKTLSLITFCLMVILSFLLLRTISRNLVTLPDPVALTLLAALTIAFVVLQGRVSLHDWISGTVITQRPGSTAAKKAALVLAALSMGSVIGMQSLRWAGFYASASRVILPEKYRLPSDERSSAQLVDFRELDMGRQLELTRWLELSSDDPVQFAVEKTRKHAVVIFGEMHEQRQALEFLQTLIPIAYQQAGVTQIVMETLMAPYNHEIDQIVTAPTFDLDRVLDLARRMDGWGIWGFQEYLDVFRVVWEENRRIPQGQARIHLVGMGPFVDAQSMAMIGLEDNPAVRVPHWEKLRVFRLLGSIPAVNWRDEFMADQVEQRVFKAGEKAIVWVGAAHSMINCAMPGRRRASRGRLGFILSQRHPGDVAQIVLHQNYGSRDHTDENSLDQFLEGLLAQTSLSSLAFEIEGGPFELIRDRNSLFFRDELLGWGDIAQNYVVLDRMENIEKCRWIPNYITEEMFVRNKPFYQSWARYFGEEAQNAADINRAFSKASR